MHNKNTNSDKSTDPENTFKNDMNYPPKDDIYNRSIKEENIDPENIKANKLPNSEMLDSNLDVPGSELDDADEFIGNEDEENNFYSLGGDNHNNLEEDQGE